MGHSLGRECCRSFSKATQGRTTLRAIDVSDFATLSPQRLPPYASHLPSSALLHSLCTPSVARTESGTRHCFAEPSIIYRLAEVNPLQPRNSGLHLPPWVLLGRGRLSLPAVALPLSPSLASPPPSLRSGTSPQGEFICLVGIVRAAAPARLRLSLRIGTHEKRLGPFYCGVGFAVRRALSEHRIERNGVPRPISIFYPITASL